MKSDQIFSIVFVVILLFIGVYMISTVAGTIFPQNIRYAYGYTTITNSTSQEVNITQNASYVYSIGAFSSITEVTPTKTISVTISNTNTSTRTVNVYLNDVSIGSFSAIGNTTTSHTFSSVDWVESATNNITYQVV